jgi:hypothetical protein
MNDSNWADNIDDWAVRIIERVVAYSVTMSLLAIVPVGIVFGSPYFGLPLGSAFLFVILYVAIEEVDQRGGGVREVGLAFLGVFVFLGSLFGAAILRDAVDGPYWLVAAAPMPIMLSALLFGTLRSSRRRPSPFGNQPGFDLDDDSEGSGA